MSLRDPEFSESLEGFISTSELTEEKKLPAHQVCFHLSVSRTVASKTSVLANACRNHAVNTTPQFHLNDTDAYFYFSFPVWALPQAA